MSRKFTNKFLKIKLIHTPFFLCHKWVFKGENNLQYQIIIYIYKKHTNMKNNINFFFQKMEMQTNFFSKNKPKKKIKEEKRMMPCVEAMLSVEA
jgi:hypothetical protein